MTEPEDPVFPVHVYGRSQGCAIIGGPVVRDATLSALTGRLLFTDYCSATFWRAGPSTLNLDSVQSLGLRVPVRTTPLINAINEDAKGRIYVLINRNQVFRLVQAK